jgi:hypothetical protein
MVRGNSIPSPGALEGYRDSTAIARVFVPNQVDGALAHVMSGYKLARVRTEPYRLHTHFFQDGVIAQTSMRLRPARLAA